MKNEEFAAAMVRGLKRSARRVWMLTGAAFLVLHSSFFMSCSEDDTDVEEFDNWQVRNEAYFATLDDSLSNTDYSWQRLLSYSLSSAVPHQSTDYIYVKKIHQGTGTESPMLTDSVRVSYQGRLLPTAGNPQGKVFDGTAYGTYADATNSTVKLVMVANGTESLLTGWITALLNMHRGDHWRIYIPQELGYKKNDQTSNSTGEVTIPAYSTLVFDITLVDFSPAGTAMKPYRAPRR